MKPAPRHRVIQVAAGLVFKDGRVLVTRRRPRDTLGGLWEFPGGKCERGETFSQALRRELQEELTIDVDVGPHVDTIDHDYPDCRVHIEFYRCRLRSGEPKAIGCAALAWVTAEELRHYPMPPADARLLKRLWNDPTLWID
ncbi:MAG TPA: 8-oxo-dGTP diphosphatase MutT [Verrucomicrobiota bacterium]|nr:8-oxo-dGTP diphosphatase MutT [Verrucomicrobiota bacterium]HNU50278.1 8-oxo-dGTP diphosphatase MutT [Verrucomicrobiota bacterium]